MDHLIKAAEVVKVYDTLVWVESDMLGSKHVMLQSELPGSSPFCYCSFNYGYGYTDNQAVHQAALSMAISLGAQEPVEYRMREFCLIPRPVQRSSRRVVCAAIRSFDGDLLLGIRHYSRDMHAQIDARRDGEKFKNRRDEDQGFVDQHGVFMTREEAYQVANEQGQLWDSLACIDGLNGHKLCSEGLY